MLIAGIGIDVNEELNVELWKPVAAPANYHMAGSQGSLRRKAKTPLSTSGVSMQTPLVQSPITTSPETDILTPPAVMAAPPQKKIKRNHGVAISRSYTSTLPGKYPFSFLLFYFKRAMVLD
jgi:hypothetical protein